MVTRADRLNALLLKMGAATQEEIDAHEWSDGQCPYVIMTTADGGRRLTIDKGDVLDRASGVDLGECIEKLATKYNLDTVEG